MLEWGTWVAVAILGPGSIAVFVWFLRDLRELLRDPRPEGEDDG